MDWGLEKRLVWHPPMWVLILVPELISTLTLDNSLTLFTSHTYLSNGGTNNTWTTGGHGVQMR